MMKSCPEHLHSAESTDSPDETVNAEVVTELLPANFVGEASPGTEVIENVVGVSETAVVDGDDRLEEPLPPMRYINPTARMATRRIETIHFGWIRRGSRHASHAGS